MSLSNISLSKVDSSEYSYALPDDLIALYPLQNRSDSRLLVYNGKEIHHQKFSNIGDELPAKTILLVNDTKVIPARLFFNKSSGARVEIFLLTPLNESLGVECSSCIWSCSIGNLKKWKNEPFLLDERQGIKLKATLLDRSRMQVLFEWNASVSFLEVLEIFGNIPLPPYINRKAEVSDSQNYQTVFAQFPGSVAAPTAGLHFTTKLRDDLRMGGHQFLNVTLHVSSGTFRPLKVSNALEHPMHMERISIPMDTLKELYANETALVAVGTTSLRSIESVIWYGYNLMEDAKADFFIEKLRPYKKKGANPKDALEVLISKMEKDNSRVLEGETELMIVPGYKFQLVKGLVTNFHQPNSTLLMIVDALIGKAWKEVYSDAIAKKYRFLSYGDACFFLS